MGRHTEKGWNAYFDARKNLASLVLRKIQRKFLKIQEFCLPKGDRGKSLLEDSIFYRFKIMFGTQ